MSQLNDSLHITTAHTYGWINIWNIKKVSENKFSIELITSF